MSKNEHHAAVVKYCKLGFTDVAIANFLGLKQLQVFTIRTRQANISSKQVVQNRYDTWEKLIDQGKSVEEVAQIYKVKEKTVRMAMWDRDRSFVEIRHAQMSD